MTWGVWHYCIDHGIFTAIMKETSIHRTCNIVICADNSELERWHIIIIIIITVNLYSAFL